MFTINMKKACKLSEADSKQFTKQIMKKRENKVKRHASTWTESCRIDGSEIYEPKECARKSICVISPVENNLYREIIIEIIIHA